MAWWDTHITQGFKWTWQNTKAHSGIDLAESNGTPLTAAVAGEVIHAGVHDWGGQVSIRFNTHGKDMTLSYLHLSDIAPGIQAGTEIQAGTFIGKSGGATWSRPYSTASKYSSGPHLHFELWVGDRAPYVDQSPWRPDEGHYPIDPTNMFLALKAHGIPGDQSAFSLSSDGQAASDGSGIGPSSPPPAGQRAHAILQEAPGFYGIVLAVDSAMTPNAYKPPPNLAPVTVSGANVGPVDLSPVLNAAFAQGTNETNAFRSVTYGVGWLANNIIPLLVRSFCIFLGVGLIAALLFAQVRRSELAQEVGGAAKTAALAAL